MPDIKDVINEINIDDISYQLLMKGNTELVVKGKKGDKYLQVKFESDPEYINQNKEAIIVWVDNDKLQAAYNRTQAI